MKNILRSCRGLSLLETILALGLSAMIVFPLLAGFKLSVESLNDDAVERELLQHARMAMQRITSELRYAVAIGDRAWPTCPQPTCLEFYTRTLEDDDWGTETIKYQLMSGGGSCGLWRQKDAGTKYVIAGSLNAFDIAGSLPAGVIDISVCKMTAPAETLFEVQYFKWVKLGANYYLQQMVASDPTSEVAFVKIKMGAYSPKYNKTVRLYSMVKLRNK